jgi:Cu/Ag efflux protein CusF
MKLLFVATLLAATSIISTLQADDSLPPVAGEVKKVKPDSGKITIKHEPIPNLDMPGMTMVFRTDESTDISQYKKGDMVSFTVVEKDGKMYIVSIEKSE